MMKNLLVLLGVVCWLGVSSARAQYQAVGITAEVDPAALPVATDAHTHATNAQTLATTALQPASTSGWVVVSHDSLVADSDTNGWVVVSHDSLVADSDTNGWQIGSHAGFATSAQGVSGTNAETKVSVLLGSIALSTAHNSETNGVVYMQAKTTAGNNPAQQYIATVWVSKTALGVPDSSDLDIASSLTCGTNLFDYGAGGDMYLAATDGDGKISWAFISSIPADTNFFYCSIGGVPVGSIEVVTPFP